MMASFTPLLKVSLCLIAITEGHHELSHLYDDVLTTNSGASD